MECSQNTWLSDKEYLLQFNKKVGRMRVPLSGSIDLTHHCNLRCVHCYLACKSGSNDNKRELNTEEWCALIDQMVQAGTLYLLITGGEPLLREDFSQIYRHAKNSGLLVTVFTNATLVTDSIINLFQELPPLAVEISLYGASAPTYDKITGVKGAHGLCVKNIHRLKEHGINVRLKTILMTLNRHEFYDIEEIAENLGVKFRFDAAIFPRFNGDTTPLKLRVPPEEVVEKETSDLKKLHQWREFYDRMKKDIKTDYLYPCGSGLTNFHITPDGFLKPCIMTTGYKYDLKGGDFSTGWHDEIPKIRGQKISKSSKCHKCEKKSLCSYCPPFFELETGTEGTCSEYLCALGDSRYKSITKLTSS